MKALRIAKLDDSAAFELRLAEQLVRDLPDFDRTQVDLTPFLSPRAKIDVLDLQRPGGLDSATRTTLKAKLEGTVKGRNDIPNAVSIHDPTARDLRYLMQFHGRDHVAKVEIAIDVFLPPESNDIYLLRGLKEQLHHCLAPHVHPGFGGGAKRKYFDLDKGAYTVASASRAAPLTTILYNSCSRLGFDLKVYLKTIDQGKPIARYFLRIELTLEVPAHVGLDTIADIAKFGKDLRKSCGKAFFVGKGYKGKPSEMWSQRGAAWSMRTPKDLTLQANPLVNRAFGNALSDLGKKLSGLERRKLTIASSTAID
ncbi:hypothetical protein [Massilia sp. TS11]|uniref:hypothetical protein n=1 Tax=Massilia sp. TS11 TaxID=2908003 RepID=UPI001EDC4766|nr:hypothetical protein [Massilia sp. TS11]MCG2583510.1 hypothetical protein [Massilia sp. TS11]